MATLNMSKILWEAREEWRGECVERMATSFKDDPRAARRGVLGMLEPPQDAKALKQERTLLQQLAESDPSGAAYEQALTARMGASSFQETLGMMKTRLPKQGGA